LGTASGIHPHHAKRYFRRVQANKMEAPGEFFKKYNPLAVEESVWSANKTDNVLTFCVEVPDGAKTKNDLSAIDLLEIVKLTQNNWVKYGRNAKKCVKPWLMHNVSNTIHIKDEEWDDVTKYIYNNRESFAGISLLPNSGDLDYQQAPFTHVLTPKEIINKYGEGSLMASGLIVDGLRVFENNLFNACDYVLYNNLEGNSEQQDWKRRVIQFSNRYCDNDMKKCCYLMKEVNNWKLWLDLKREYVDVDYNNLIEETDETTITETIACAGGVCSLI
jgi:ribonucleoside-diphosphate reductase alpha chain